MFWSPTQALEWLKGKLSEFFNARKDLQDQYGSALLLQSRATHPADQAKASTLVKDLTVLLTKQTTLENKVREILPAEWVSGLGLAPLVIPAIALVSAIGVATAVYTHLQNVAAKRKELELIEKGILTPQEAIARQQAGSMFGTGGLTALTGNIQNIAIAGAVVVGLLFLMPLLRR